MQRKSRFILAPLCCLIISPSLLANRHSTSSMTTDTITVTAGRVAEDNRKLSLKPIVIDSEEISQNHSINLAQLLANQGIQLTAGRTTLLQSAPKIRGFGNNQTYGPDNSANVLMLLNGRRSGIANMAKFPTKNIDRIEIIRGPAAVQYGSSAIGGVINVITKRGKPETEAGFMLGVGSWQRYDVAGEYASANEQWDFSLGVSRQSMNDNYSTAKGDKVYGSYVDFMHNFSSNLGYHFNPDHRLGLIINASDNQFGQPARNVTTKNHPYETRDKNISYDVTYDGALANQQLSWLLRYYNSHDKYQEYQTANKAQRIEYYRTDLQGLQAQLTAQIEQINSTITSGVDWFEYDVEQRAKPNNYKQNNNALFMLSKTALIEDQLYLSTGLRYDKFANQTAGSKRHFYKTTPSLGMAYLPNANLKLRSNYTQGYRVPSVWESISDTRSNPGPTNNIIPNPNLRPQQANTMELGVDLNLNFFNSSLTYFQTDFKDKLSWVSDAYRDSKNTRYGQYVNRDKAKLAGFELQSAFDIGNALGQYFILEPYINATFMSKYREQGADGYWRRMQNMPQWYLSWGVRFEYPEWDFSARLHINTQTSQLANAQLETGGWSKSNLSLAKTLVHFNDGSRIKLAGQIDNLFNRNYFIYRNTTDSLYTMPGRHYYLALSYEFK